MRQPVVLQSYKVVALQLSLGHKREGEMVSKCYEKGSIMFRQKIFKKLKNQKKLILWLLPCIHSLIKYMLNVNY